MKSGSRSGENVREVNLTFTRQPSDWKPCVELAWLVQTQFCHSPARWPRALISFGFVRRRGWEFPLRVSKRRAHGTLQSEHVISLFRRRFPGASRLMGLAGWGGTGKALQHSDKSIFFSLLKMCVLSGRSDLVCLFS